MDVPILSQNVDPVFHCPGEDYPITRAVHEARLAAGWHRCDTCPARHDSTIPAARKGTANRSALSSLSVIRRTRWGVRGPWQNALTRLRAGQLTAIFTSHLARLHEDQLSVDRGLIAEPGLSAPGLCDRSSTNEQQRAWADAHGSPVEFATRADDPLVLVAGYDGRASSPDIFAGVVSAALQNGWNVLDAGRATSASLQETLRSESRAAAAVLVTGAGEASSYSGMDVFDRFGNAVSVPWQMFDVRVRQPASPTSPTTADSHRRSEVVARMRRTLQIPEPDELSESAAVDMQFSEVILELPRVVPASLSQFRTARAAGHLESQDDETTYRRWLSRWFPSGSDDRIACICFDDLVGERLRWLSETHQIRFDIVSGTGSRTHAEQLRQRIMETRSDWGILIADDDRYVCVAGRQGRCLTANQLSTWMNSATRTKQSHVTTHVPDDEERVIMLDAGRSTQSVGHETISDGLAQLGLICRLTATDAVIPQSTIGETGQ